MRKYSLVALLCVMLAGMIAGCTRDNSPAVQRVPPPGPGQDTPRREYEVNKPMPGEAPPPERR